jgi:hypothetical protein
MKTQGKKLKLLRIFVFSIVFFATVFIGVTLNYDIAHAATGVSQLANLKRKENGMDMDINFSYDAGEYNSIPTVSSSGEIYAYLIEENLIFGGTMFYCDVYIDSALKKEDAGFEFLDKNKGKNHTLYTIKADGLSEGLHSFALKKVRFTDWTLTVNFSDISKEFYIDKANPTISGTVGDGAYSNAAFTVNGSDANKSRIFHKYNGSSKSNAVTTASYTEVTDYAANPSKAIPLTSSDGWYSFIVQDVTGKTSSVYWVYLDKTAPSFTLNAYYKNGDTVKATITETNMSQWYLDGVAKGTGKSISITADSLSEGTHTIRVVDLAGNETSRSFTVDRTSPTLYSNIANGGYTKTGFSIGKSVEPNWDKLYWKYTGASKTNGATTTSYDGVTTDASKTIAASEAEGWYSFLAVDKLGYASEVYWVCLDKSAPVIDMLLKSGGNFVDGQHIGSLPYFSITEQYGNSYTFLFAKKTVAGTYGATSYNWSGFLDAPIYFDNRIVNFNAGLFSRTVFYTRAEAENYVRQEEYKRITSMTNWTNAVSGTIIASEAQYAISGASYYKYIKSNGDAFIFFDRERLNVYIETTLSSYISSSTQNYFFEEGDFRVTVTDSAGNVTVKYFTLDLTAPVLSLNKSVNADGKIYFEIDGIINISASDKNFDKLYLDGGDVGAARSFSASDLSEGVHTFRAVDKAGNFTEISFTVDLTAPLLSLSNNKTFYKFGDTVTLNITETNRESVFLDGVQISAWSSLAVGGNGNIGAGAHLFTVYDKAGNASSVAFTVDNAAPTLSTDKAYYNASEVVTAIANDENLLNLTLDGSDVSAARSFSASELIEGLHTFRATDKAGNYAEVSFTVDKTAPAFALNEHYRDGQTVSATITEINISKWYLDGADNGNGKNISVLVGDLSEGTHIIRVVDLAGNELSRSFTVDKTAPSFTVNDYYNASQTVGATITEINISRWYLDGADSGNGKNISVLVNDLSEGIHTIRVVDLAGNELSRSFTVDKTAPSFALNEYYRDGQTVNATITETYMSKWYLDNADNGSGKNISVLVGDLSEGTHTIRVVDLAGNELSRSFTVDKTAPTLFSDIADGGYTNNSFSVGKLSELNWDKLYWKYTGASKTNGATTTSYDGVTTDASKTIPASEAEGWYSFIAVDKAGNQSAAYFVYLDSSAPVFNILRRDGGTVLDGTFVNSIVYFTVTETSNQYSFVFFKKISDAWVLTEWTDFQNKPVYFDRRENNFTTLFSRNVFYTQDAANAYIQAKEETKIIKRANWQAGKPGVTVPGNEAQYAVAGNDYWEYTYRDASGAETVYVFFALDRTKAYISNTTVPTLRGNSAQNYFFEEGEFKVEITDASGYTASKTFTLDLTAPVLSIDKDSKIYGIADGITVTASDTNFDKLTLDGSDVGSTRTFAASDLSEGVHIFRAVDKAGNYTEITFTVDLTPPSLSVSKQAHADGNIYYKDGSVNVTVSDGLALDKLTLDGFDVGASRSFAVEDLSEGTHTFIATDKAGNTSSVTFTVDKTAPTLATDKNLYALYDTVTVSVADEYLERLDLDSVTQTAPFAFIVGSLSEGIRAFTAYDKAGNTTTKTVTVDKTPPEFTLQTFYNLGDIVYLDITPINDVYTVTLDGIPTVAKTFNFADAPNGGYGSHVFVVTDLAGNVTEKSFFYGTTSPKVSLLKGNSQYTGTVYLKDGESVTLKVQEPQYNRTTLNGAPLTLIDGDEPNAYFYAWNADELNEGAYVINVYDNASNLTSVTFIVDKTSPELLAKKDNVTQAGLFYLKNNQTLRITASDINLSHVMNAGEREEGVSYTLTANSSNYADGLYTLTAYDKAGNSATVSFVVDKTPPTVNAAKNGITAASGAFLSASDKISFVYSDINLGAVKLNGVQTTNTEFKAADMSDGVYTVTVTDLAENVGSFVFTVDKTAPVVTIKKNGSTVASGSYFKASDGVTVTVADANADKTFLDDNETPVTNISASSLYEGGHIFRAVDKAGNAVTVTFIIDKTAPTITLNKAFYSNENRAYYNASETIVLTATDNYSFALTLNGNTLNQTAFEASSLEDGVYTATVTDLAGNSASTVFVIDKTTPAFSVANGITGGLYTDGFIANGLFLINPVISETNKTTGYYIDGILYNGTGYYQASALNDGEHTVSVRDKAENQTTLTFTVDKTAPVVTLNKAAHTDGKYYYRLDETIQFSAYDAHYDRAALGGDVIEYDAVLANDLKGAATDYRELQFYFYDSVDNYTLIRVVVVVQTPTVQLRKNSVTVGSGTHFKATDTVSFYRSSFNLGAVAPTVTLDGEAASLSSFSASTLSEGAHTITVTDAAGYIASATFTVDKTAPSFILNAYYNAAQTVNVVCNEINFDYLTLDGVTQSHEKFDFPASAMNDGQHKIRIYDLAGNYAEVSFIVDKTAPNFSLNEYYRAGQNISLIISEANSKTVYLDGAEISATTIPANTLSDGQHKITVTDIAGNTADKTFIVDTVSPTLSLFKNSLSVGTNAYYSASDVLSFTVYDVNLASITLDGANIEPGEIDLDGLSGKSYTLTVTDKAGNIVSLSFTVDKTAPTVSLRKNGGEVGADTHFKAGNSISIVVTEANRDRAYLDDAETNLTYWNASDLFEGEHVYTVYDKAGNFAVIKFTVDKTAPVIALNKASNADGKTYYNADELIILDLTELNLSSLTVGGAPLDLSAPYFYAAEYAEGTYVVTATDRAGNQAALSVVIDKTAPVLEIKNGVAGEYVTSGLVVPASATLYAQLSDINGDFYTLDGTRATSIPSVSTLEDGLHRLVGYDKAGNFAVVDFIVDKTAPLLRLVGKSAADDGKVYYNASEIVQFFYDDENFSHIKLNNATITETEIDVSSLDALSYNLDVYDLAGNYTRLTFYVDKDAPGVTLKKNAETVDNDGVFFKADQILSITTTDTLSGVYLITLDGDVTVFKSWNVSSLSDGLHRIRVYDRAGNLAEISFTVDNTPPSFYVQEYYKAGDVIDIFVNETNIAQILFDGELTTTLYFLANELLETTHTVRVVDLAGNATEKSFIIDVSSPELLLMKNSVETENGIHLKDGDTFSIQVSDAYLVTVYFDGEPTTSRLWAANGLDERVHTITAIDPAGNVTEATFTVDLTAPSFALNEYYLTGETVVLEVAETNGYTVFLDGIPTAALTFFANDLTEGAHTINVVDLAGNSFAAAFTVDLFAPTLTLSGYGQDGQSAVIGGDGTSYGALTLSAADVAPSRIAYSKDGGEVVYTNSAYIQNPVYTVDALLVNSGVWLFFAEDINGYVTELITVTLDFSPPIYELNGIVTLDGVNAYTNTTFVYTKENSFAKIYYNKDGSDFVYTAFSYIQIEAASGNEGVYTFYVEDAFGRRSDTITVTLSFTFDFKNVENIGNSYKQNTWYNVTLPYKIFGATSRPDVSGTYSFVDYENALSFAVAKEKEYRAVIVDGGYSYVSVSNESVYIVYPTETELNAAINFYASKYVSSRRTFSHLPDRNSYDVISPDVSALTANALTLPDFLQDYYGLNVYLARKSFTPTNNAALSPSFVALTYLGNLNGTVAPFSFPITYGQTFENALKANSNFYEGYYLYVERDLCGNEQRAIVFIDFSEPTLSAHIERGDGAETLTVNKDAVGARSGVFYVTEFSFIDLFDNIDDFIGVYITSEKFYGTFTHGDILPILNADLGAGKYTVTVYDRSYNLLTFDVIVAGREPSWYYGSLSSSAQSVAIYIYKNDQYNAFTSLKLAKIMSDGTYIYLDADGVGTTVSISATAYTLTAGGKYTFIIEDVYGRRTEFEPIFYEKGLPSGRLVGVTNGAATKNTVTFDFADTFGLTVFTLAPSGARIPYVGASPSYSASLRTYTATFAPNAGETVSYLLVLYSLADAGIYIEYSFTLDTESPDFLITDRNGAELAPNTSTNIPFSVAWGEETATARIAKNGASSSAYAQNTVISANGLYTFTLTDKCGNAAIFTVYLDSEVSFSFDNSPTLISDNVYLSNKAQKIAVGEDFKIFSCVDKGGNSYVYGIALDTENEYTITIEDMYGNAAAFTLILDFSAPTFTLENVKDGLSNKAVTVRVDDGEAVILEVTSNYVNTKGIIENGKIYEVEGAYYFKATDRAGNSATATFTIDKRVDYTTNIANGLITTNAVTVTFREDVTQIVTIDGAELTPNTKYSAPGRYALEALDRAGNVLKIEFEILPNRVRAFAFTAPEGFSLARLVKGVETLALSDGDFTLTESGKYSFTLKAASGTSYSFDITVDAIPPEVKITEKNNVYSFSRLSKDNVTAALYIDGVLIEDFRLSASVKDKGSYLLVLTDDLGNENSYEFEIKSSLNAFSIILIILAVLGAGGGVFLVVKGRVFKVA